MVIVKLWLFVNGFKKCNNINDNIYNDNVGSIIVKSYKLEIVTNHLLAMIKLKSMPRSNENDISGLSICTSVENNISQGGESWEETKISSRPTFNPTITNENIHRNERFLG